MYLFGLHIVYIWVIVLIATVAIEAVTLNLAAIWFSVGALVALICASLQLPLGGQLVIFVIVSALCLAFVRPFTKRFLRVKGEHTNSDRIIGQTAIVTEEINNALSQGQIKLMGQSWSARNIIAEEILPIGEEVQVLSISGVKAIVQRIEEN